MALPTWPPLPVTLWDLHHARQRVNSFVWLSLWSISPVVGSGRSKALLSWAGCHVKHGARSSQLGSVEAGSRSWLVARVSLEIREDWL